ncbi:MAG: hypothetical protein Q8S13_02730 [Dehalococcoidia bacterium]|nr:hypothetical protein [Dehalococcoidia bacterium]
MGRDIFARVLARPDRKGRTRSDVEYEMIDTEDADDADFGSAARIDPETREAVCVHVTDDESPVVEALKRGVPIARSGGDRGDIGGGLYCSDNPALWMGRSHGKWAFLERLSRGERARLVRAILSSWQFKDRGYLTRHEKERAKRDLLRYVENPDHKYAVIYASDQPYNVRSWETKFLTALGIAPGRAPKQVEMRVRGRFAKVNRGGITEDTVAELRGAGAAGAFAPGDFVNPPQLVAWDNDAVRKFGPFDRDAHRRRR